MPSLGHNRVRDQADHISRWARARQRESVVEVGFRIESNKAIVGESSNVIGTDGKTRRLRPSE